MYGDGRLPCRSPGPSLPLNVVPARLGLPIGLRCRRAPRPGAGSKEKEKGPHPSVDASSPWGGTATRHGAATSAMHQSP
jgi:hypothetical protein